MPVVSATDLLSAAKRGGYAVGYFEAWDMQSIEAVLTAGELERSPVVIGFGLMTADPAWAAGRAVPYFAALAGAAGRESSVPVSLILNEARLFDHARLGVELGFNIVMLDGSVSLPGKSGIETQKALVELAHPRGIAVEAELGELPTVGEESSGVMTNPDEAALFVAETGIDILSVSVGNVHCARETASPIDLERLSAIGRSVQAPLSLHGGSGLPNDCIAGAIAAGVAKINVGTIMKRVFRDSLVRSCASPSELSDVQKCIGSGGSHDVLKIASDAVTVKVRELMRLYGSSGKS